MSWSHAWLGKTSDPLSATDTVCPIGRINATVDNQRRKPELMSPAGHWPQLRAAIEAGADAVYFGLNHFSARAKVGFTLAELPSVMDTLHERGVKGFVTFNTLVFDHEIDEALRAIGEIEQAAVDAIIVQDVGIAQLAARHFPELDIHGSTQMSVTSAQGAEFARALGCSRVVLGRELSLQDIRRIAQQTTLELEVFVHGALCVSYSGQCFSSEAWGGRSANRGQCAQACRLSYDLIVDSRQRDLGEYRYLLSPGDLYALEQIPELVDIGVACLKIEGRYKDADYVALTTQAYREAIDKACLGMDCKLAPNEFQQIEQIYSRGLGPSFISGTNHQQVVQGRAPRHRGVLVGQVTKVCSDSVELEIKTEIRRGDGLVFDAAAHRSPDEPEEGGFVYEVIRSKDSRIRLIFGKQSIDFSRIRSGDLVWRTHDPQLSKSLSGLTKAKSPVFTRPLDLKVIAKCGEPISITAQTAEGIQAEFHGSSPLAIAEKRALDELMLREQLGRLGGTPFHLGKFELELDANLFVPVSELNAARRELVEQLLAMRRNWRAGKDRPAGLHAADESGSIANRPAAEETENRSELSPRIHLLVRTAEQLAAAIENKPASITLDYLELYGLRPSVERIQAAGIHVRVASPRILKPTEQNVIRFLLSLNCEILVRSAGLLHDLDQYPKSERPLLSGDFSLNVANVKSMQLFADLGLQRITPTHDLNAQQIAELAEQVHPSLLEVVAFQHLPVFHTEHCVFCRFLSSGTDSSNCGHPCEKHRIALRDSQGREHPVMADVGCRNTVFSVEAQTAARFLKLWQSRGISHFRLEFVHETPEQVSDITQAFHHYFAGEISPKRLQGRLDQIAPAHTTDGSLFVPKDFKQIYQLQ